LDSRTCFPAVGSHHHSTVSTVLEMIEAVGYETPTLSSCPERTGRHWIHQDSVSHVLANRDRVPSVLLPDFTEATTVFAPPQMKRPRTCSISTNPLSIGTQEDYITGDPTELGMAGDAERDEDDGILADSAEREGSDSVEGCDDSVCLPLFHKIQSIFQGLAPRRSLWSELVEDDDSVDSSEVRPLFTMQRTDIADSMRFIDPIPENKVHAEEYVSDVVPIDYFRYNLLQRRNRMPLRRVRKTYKREGVIFNDCLDTQKRTPWEMWLIPGQVRRCSITTQDGPAYKYINIPYSNKRHAAVNHVMLVTQGTDSPESPVTVVDTRPYVSVSSSPTLVL